MTKEEAIKAMSEGKKVRHRYFSPEEWVALNPDGTYLFEDGYSVLPELFWYDRQASYWNDGWEYFREND